MRPRPGLVFVERHLERLRGFARSDAADPERRAARVSAMLAYWEGAVLAYERLGWLSGEEAARWRQRLVDPEDGIDPGSELGAEAREAAERYLAERVRRVTRQRWPSTLPAGGDPKCEAAIRTLREVGILDDEAQARWLAEAWRRRSPWRTEPGELPPPATIVIWPHLERPRTAREEARRVAKARKTIGIRRVIAGSADRHGDLAIVALAVHGGATSLHFHYLGGTDWDKQGFTYPRAAQLVPIDRITAPVENWAARKSLRPLTPPALRDDTGHSYQPVGNRPHAAGRAWFSPGAREPLTGYWLYTPAAPPDAREFTAQRGSFSWTLQD